MQVLVDTHEMPDNSSLYLVGAGAVCIVHDVPFHRPAAGVPLLPDGSPPTTMQALADVHETEFNQPDSDSVVSTDHDVPFQCSASMVSDSSQA